MDKNEKRHKKLEDLMHARNIAELAFLKAQNELLAFQAADAYEQAQLKRQLTVGQPIINREHLPVSVKEELNARREEALTVAGAV